ncbi:MAG: hypothetical protein WBL74_12105 [Novosphingobium sp.]|uniref:hypothetical protein n=1 Tax=Novosphingobium sp. TaxID=1874826 RepID=UPI003C7B3785
MTDHSIRLFESEAAVRRIGEGLLARTLPRADWTHEAHLAACAWLVTERPEIHPEAEMPQIIRTYNVAVGGENTDSAGYHETLTQLYIIGVRRFLAGCGDGDLLGKINALLTSEMAPRDWPLRFYSRERLFSLEARRGWVEPDLRRI